MTTITYPCQICEGTGKVSIFDTNGNFLYSIVCYHCNGTGQLPLYPPYPLDYDWKYRFTI